MVVAERLGSLVAAAAVVAGYLVVAFERRRVVHVAVGLVVVGNLRQNSF